VSNTAQQPHVLTPFGTLATTTTENEHEPAGPADAERDALLTQLALNLLRPYPWLVQILTASHAVVLANKGYFAVSVPSRDNPPQWTDIEVPPLSAHLRLMPWAEPDETPQ
jgi:hypothetical protein